MPAGAVLRSAARMKDRGAPVSGQAGQVEFFERAGRRRRDLARVRYMTRNSRAMTTEFLVRFVIGELKREQFEREAIEFCAGLREPALDPFAQVLAEAVES